MADAATVLSVRLSSADRALLASLVERARGELASVGVDLTPTDVIRGLIRRAAADGAGSAPSAPAPQLAPVAPPAPAARPAPTVEPLRSPPRAPRAAPELDTATDDELAAAVRAACESGAGTQREFAEAANWHKSPLGLWLTGKRPVLPADRRPGVVKALRRWQAKGNPG